MAILVLFSTSSALLEIRVGGRAIGISLLLIRCCRRSSQSLRRSSNCSWFQANACLTPSPFGRGERNSKCFVGPASSMLAVGCERSGSVDAESPEHGGNVQGRG
jgi:hypothetical protein